MLQDCPDGECCVLADSPFEIGSGSFCTVGGDTPIAAGEPCVMPDLGDLPMGDDCDVGLQCWSASAGDPDGICVPLCHEADPDSSCPGQCAACDWADGFGVCAGDCDGEPCDSESVCDPHGG